MSRSELGAPGAVWKWPLVPGSDSAAAFPWVLSFLGANATGKWHWMAPGTVLSPGTDWYIRMEMLPGLQKSQEGEQSVPGAGVIPVNPLVPEQRCPWGARWA